MTVRPQARPAVHRMAYRGTLIAGFCIAAAFAVLPARAQYFDWREGYYDDGPYGPGPMYPDGPYGGYDRPYYRRAAPRPQAPSSQSQARPSSNGMSLADIRDRTAQRGMHLIATPRRKGKIYLAAAEDAQGIRHRLVFDALDGRLIENTVLGHKTPLPGQAGAVAPQTEQKPAPKAEAAPATPIDSAR